MSKWQEKRLGEVAEINPESISNKNFYNTISYVDISSVKEGILYGVCNYSINNAPERAKRILRNNDIIISTVRPNLKAYYFVKNDIPNLICSTGFAVLRAKNKIVSRFLYYLISNESFINYLSLIAKGSAYPAVDKKDFINAKINIPDLATQEKIADILSTYDDLIENNNRRIEILEQMAQEIYKEWFVRFRFPGHEKVKFVNGIPEGWEVKKIGDIATIKSGYAFKSSWWQEEGIPVIKIKDIQNNGIDTNNFAYVSEIHMEKAKQFIAEPGDIVIALTGATIGKIGLIPFYHKPLLINQRVGKFFCGEKPILNNGYLYILLQQNWIKDLIFMISSSSAAQPNISPNDIEEIKIFYNKNVIEQFNQKISDYILQILKLKNINQNLIKQRDLLLPRLMSGKLEV